MRKQIVISLMLLLPWVVKGQTIDELWKKANEEYIENNFKEAAVHYQEILSTGNYSFELYFNLANAYYHLDTLGKAILYYEKAKLLDAENEDLKYNLARAERERKDKIKPVVEPFVDLILRNVSGAFSRDGWAFGSIIFSGLILIIFVLARNQKVSVHLRIPIFASLTLLLIVFLYLGRARASYDQIQKGIITASKTWLLTSPGGSKEISQLNEGTSFVITEEFQNDWYEIKLVDGNKGWVFGPDTGIIKLGENEQETTKPEETITVED